MTRVAVVGAGLIGKERVKAVGTLKKRGRPIDLVGIYDPIFERTKELASEWKCEAFRNLDEVASRNPDWVVVAIPHDVAVPTTCSLLDNSLKVLVEKPMGRSKDEAKQLLAHCKSSDQLAVGFNYRFYEGIRSAIRDTLRGDFGQLISVSFLLGHGGDPNMASGWKLDPVRAGGGSLIDPGIHLLDLTGVILGTIPEVDKASCWRGFWKTGIEEETHLLLSGNHAIANLQISVVHWRSTFRMEINGTDGYGVVTGRGRSYGLQTYSKGKRWGWLSGKKQADTEEIVLETTGNDVFADEMDALFFDKNLYPINPCTSIEGLKNMELFDQCMRNLEDCSLRGS